MFNHDITDQSVISEIEISAREYIHKVHKG